MPKVHLLQCSLARLVFCDVVFGSIMKSLRQPQNLKWRPVGMHGGIVLQIVDDEIRIKEICGSTSQHCQTLKRKYAVLGSAAFKRFSCFSKVKI